MSITSTSGSYFFDSGDLSIQMDFSLTSSGNFILIERACSAAAFLAAIFFLGPLLYLALSFYIAVIISLLRSLTAVGLP